MKQVRCAIYTRKSSEEGLEQDFNSLHAQREACAAYVLSQASEGWTLLPQHYDDGGISGGTLERPGLQQLLADIAAGQIDIVVVYKVDRLTRSLLDFAKLVEAFDKSDTSFVSITQSFNTTTSMGRLTLNMLLSFAQFEREVTAERIRDKLAASKAKGMWMGGVPPLGYRADGRTLAIVDEHAAIVRHIYARYRRLGNVRLLAEEFKREGITVPRRTAGTGRAFGGGQFTRGQFYQILKTPIYVGDIPHRDKVYPGNHPPLIARGEWQAVQRQLAGNTQGERRARSDHRSPLAGLIFDGQGEPLLAAHANKWIKCGQGGSQAGGENGCDGSDDASENGGQRRRYRYYVSKALHTGTADPDEGGMRLPAPEVETMVARELAGLFADPIALAEVAGLGLQPAMLKTFATACEKLASELETSPNFARFVERLTVDASTAQLTVSAGAVSKAVGVPLADGAPTSFTRSCEARLTRTGRAIRLVHRSGALASDKPNASVLWLLVRARKWWAELAKGELDPTTLAAREGVTLSYLVRVVRLAFLSPHLVDGILAGRLRAEVDGRVLVRPRAISLDWDEQERRYLAS